MPSGLEKRTNEGCSAISKPRRHKLSERTIPKSPLIDGLGGFECAGYS